jgi:hypothetical protein
MTAKKEIGKNAAKQAMEIKTVPLNEIMKAMGRNRRRKIPSDRIITSGYKAL